MSPTCESIADTIIQYLVKVSPAWSEFEVMEVNNVSIGDVADGSIVLRTPQDDQLEEGQTVFDAYEITLIDQSNNEYDFEPAKKSKDEIFRYIRQSDIFVLLISKESLSSEWVKIEVAKARQRMLDGKIEFYPYIIDPDVNFTTSVIPEWITKEECLNLKTFLNVKLLHREINAKQKQLLYKKRPDIQFKDELFVGRNNEIEQLETH